MSIDHGFKLPALRAALDAEPWERDPYDPDTMTRSVYLGTVGALYPSGKFYVPFACSNLDRCAACRGRGTVATVRRRTEKRRASRNAKARRLANKRWAGFAGGEPAAYETRRAYCAGAHRAMLLAQRCRVSCAACGGMGSREAYLDERWREAVEQAFASIGCAMEHGEGDSWDLFAVEYRDVADVEPEESEVAE